MDYLSVPLVEYAHADFCKLDARKFLVAIGMTLALLMERGYSPELGARPMERAIESLIAQPLAKMILEGSTEQNRKVIARADGRNVIFRFG